MFIFKDHQLLKKCIIYIYISRGRERERTRERERERETAKNDNYAWEIGEIVRDSVPYI